LFKCRLNQQTGDLIGKTAQYSLQPLAMLC